VSALAGRTALVTGAAGGIGVEIARAFWAAGARMCLTGRNTAGLEALNAELGGDHVVVTADVSQPEEVARLAREALAGLGQIDVLVNNAGITGRRPAAELDAEFIDRVYATNVRGPLLLASALVPGMQAQGGGSIVNVSSITGVVGTLRRTTYAASKGGIDGATRALANELGPDNIRVNSVAPGIVDGDAWIPFRTIEGFMEGLTEQTPLRRLCDPAEVAQVILFLASDASSFVTGQTIIVDGGITKTLQL
jgi:NAD(P)-dependent dehydrogenase (short-subunit alcohol dehydrogenase family)